MQNKVKIELFDGEIGYTSEENKLMIERLKEAISYVNSHSHSGNTTDRTLEKLYQAYEYISDNNTDHFVLNQLMECEEAVIDASKYCGYCNIQYETKKTVYKILHPEDELIF